MALKMVKLIDDAHDTELHLALLGQTGDPVRAVSAADPDMVVGEAGVGHGVQVDAGFAPGLEVRAHGVAERLVV